MLYWLWHIQQNFTFTDKFPTYIPTLKKVSTVYATYYSLLTFKIFKFVSAMGFIAF